MKKYLLLTLLTSFLLTAQAQDPRWGYALQFNGTTNFATADALCAPLVGKDFTIEFWFKLSGTPSDFNALAVFNPPSADATDNRIETGVGYGADQKFYVYSPNSGTVTTYGTTTITVGTWYHVAITYTYTTGNIVAYLNGQQELTKTIPASDRIQSNDRFSLGQEWDNSSRSALFHGELDEVRIWDDIRTISELNYNRYSELAGTDANLLAYYKMSNGSGTSLTDDSPNSYTGTLLNGIVWVTSTVPHPYSGGTGISGNPYQIATTADLIYLSQHSEDWGKYFIQTANIDFGADETLVDWNGDGSADGAETPGFSPIGNGATPFSGSYNGQNFAISNIYINRGSSDYVGLFGYAHSGTIQNLNLLNIDIVGKAKVGALVGATFVNVSTTISNCSSSGNVSGNGDYVGGLVGLNESSGISNSYSVCNVSGGGLYTGSFVGDNNQSTISKCYSTGNVSSSGNYTGGFAGYNDGTISNCYNTGSITRSSGTNTGFGGFCGWNDGNVIQYCYSSGVVYSSAGIIWNEGGVKDKGFVGVVSGSETHTANFFDSENSGQTTGTGATAKTTAQMKNQSSFTGWDFATPIWNITTGDYISYPYLNSITYDTPGTSPAVNPIPGLVQLYSGGVGTSGAPYEIATVADLVYLSQHSGDWSKYFKQTADIDFGADETLVDWNGDGSVNSTDKNGFSPIGNSTIKFTGNYDGQYYTISNLYISRSGIGRMGLFGCTNGSTISSVGLVNASVVGGSWSGLLVGENNNGSTITICYSTGSVTGSDNVGGLVGYNQNTGSTISNCYSQANVSGAHYVGGLVGMNNYSGVVNYSFSTGQVSASSTTGIGGLVGLNINLATTSNSYWDTNTSGQASSAGGTGLTTAQMKTASSFTNWDFATTPPIWNIKTGDYISYPYLNSFTYDTPGTTPAVNPIPGLFQFYFYSGGDGTSETPYEIATVADLVYLSQHSADWNKYFIQTANIDFGSDETLVDWDGDGAADGVGTTGFSPIGNITTPFSGNYNGQNYVVDNLFIDNEDQFYLGFFGKAYNAEITDVNLKNVDITGTMVSNTNQWVGGLVGELTYTTSISNCEVDGIITSGDVAGGLIGKAYYPGGNTTILNCKTSGRVVSPSWTGGLIGEAENTSITNSYSTSVVEGGWRAGGLIGAFKDGCHAQNCYATGNVIGNDDELGGFAGYNVGEIVDCYSIGNVTRSGGTNTSYGGFCGYNENYIAYCYSSGAVYSSVGTIWNEGGDKDKGFVGGVDGSPTHTANFFDTETSGQTTGTGATAKTTAQMKNQSTFTSWDFATTPIWNIKTGDYISYPYLNSITYDTPGTSPAVNPIPGLEDARMILTYTVPANATIGLPLNGTVSVTIDWGDGNTENVSSSGVKEHTYTSAGTYTVKIGGTLTAFGISAVQPSYSANLTGVISFGNIGLSSLDYAFYFASSLTDVPGKLPASVTVLSNTFYKASNFNDADISSWDVSLVTNMSGLFFEASKFNQPIGSWNVGNVTDMSNMFSNASDFNQDISSWDVSKVTNMYNMFSGAGKFNQPIGSWNVGNVTTMAAMFNYASVFNQNISSWDVSKVTDMRWMFYKAFPFNQNLGSWNIGNVTNMQNMFSSDIALSTTNYDALLNGWEAKAPNLKNAVTLSTGPFYTSAAAAARQTLTTAPYSWAITDAGLLGITSITASDATPCSGTSITLTAAGTLTGCTVHWYTGSCGGTELTTGLSGTNNEVLTVSPTVTTTYYAKTEISGTYSSDCASATITVSPLLQYRSKQTGSWTTAANWEQYNGTGWVSATSYPGEISNGCSNPMVTIQSGHTMSLGAGVITIPNLAVADNATLNVDVAAKLTVSSTLTINKTTTGGKIQVIDIP